MTQLLIENSLQEAAEMVHNLRECRKDLEYAGQLLVTSLKSSRKIFFAGNGGSAADAQHFAAELIGRFEKVNKLPGIALTTDTSILTALANDFSYDEVFSIQLEALGQPGDVFVGISTSGNSKNIVQAAQICRQLEIPVIGMTGADGGRLSELSEVTLKTPHTRTSRIQEGHAIMGHILFELIEESV